MDGADERVVVRRSTRRRRSVSAKRVGEALVIDIPAHFSAAEEAEWVARMTERLRARDLRNRLSDDELAARATVLSERYMGGAAKPESVRWVANQGARWGSCTPSKRSIRISHRLGRAPAWVLDYVLIHELAHLLEPHHNDYFWALVSAYPQTERARGFLEGVSAAAWLNDDGQDPQPLPEV